MKLEELLAKMDSNQQITVYDNPQQEWGMHHTVQEFKKLRSEYLDWKVRKIATKEGITGFGICVIIER